MYSGLSISTTTLTAPFGWLKQTKPKLLLVIDADQPSSRLGTLTFPVISDLPLPPAPVRSSALLVILAIPALELLIGVKSLSLDVVVRFVVSLQFTDELPRGRQLKRQPVLTSRRYRPRAGNAAPEAPLRRLNPVPVSWSRWNVSKRR
jgi:hypothetical protein